MQAHKRSFLAKNCILPFLIKSFPLLLPSHNIASIIKQCSVFKVHLVLFSALHRLTSVSGAPLRFRLLNFSFKKLNETSKFLSLLQSVSFIWWRVPGSNRWPPACKAGALPAELTPHIEEVVGQNGLEPSTSRLSVVCSSQLSYWPISFSTSTFGHCTL